MKNKSKINRSHIAAFRKPQSISHFTAQQIPLNDILGSYTGTPINNGKPDEDTVPTQDADDL